MNKVHVNKMALNGNYHSLCQYKLPMKTSHQSDAFELLCTIVVFTG